MRDGQFEFYWNASTTDTSGRPTTNVYYLWFLGKPDGSGGWIVTKGIDRTDQTWVIIDSTPVGLHFVCVKVVATMVEGIQGESIWACTNDPMIGTLENGVRGDWAVGFVPKKTTGLKMVP